MSGLWGVFKWWWDDREEGWGNNSFDEKYDDKKLDKGGIALPFVSSMFKGIVLVYIKDMEDKIPDMKCKEIYCEVCRHNTRKLGWAKHLNTKKYWEWKGSRRSWEETM